MEKLELVILETSDIHGNIFPIDYSDHREQHIGLGKIASLVNEERRQHEHVLLIDNGDLLQGTPLTYHYVKNNQYKPNPVIKITNEMKYDAAVYGNHEFNYGKKVLEQMVRESNFPWLSANLLNEATGKTFLGEPYIIKEFADCKVAILGLTTPYIPNWEQPEHIQGIHFADPVQQAKKWVPFLRNEKNVDLVIVSYHGGFEKDMQTGKATEALTGENQGCQLCQEVEEIDVLLTGHQHRQIAGEEINGVVIVQPGSKGATLGKVVLHLEKNGQWVCVNKQSTLLSASEIEADQHVLALVEEYESETQSWLDEPIGRIIGDMQIHDPFQVRLKDHPLIEFINHVQMHATNTNISCTSLFDNESTGLPEHVTMRDIVSNYKYPNTLKVIRISGQDIKDGLEQSATYFEQYTGDSVKVNPAFITPKPQHYNFDMWEGIEYTINISKPIGERIVKLMQEGNPLNMTQTYDVVMNNYRAGGGGNFFMYKGKPVIREVSIDVSELLADYFLQKKTVHAKINDNWSVIHD